MHRTTTTLLLTAVLLPALAGCSSHDPDPAACRKAVKAQYVPGTGSLKGEPGRPKECDGLSEDELSKIVLGVIEENTQ